MNRYILTDTCFWIGLFDETDGYHQTSWSIFDLIKEHTILLPFPCLYEIIRIKYVKNKTRLAAFENFIKSNTVDFIFDEQYRNQALEKVYTLNKDCSIYYSLVNSVLREMISDINLKLEYLITYNSKDFADICAKRNVTIIDQ